MAGDFARSLPYFCPCVRCSCQFLSQSEQPFGSRTESRSARTAPTSQGTTLSQQGKDAPQTISTPQVRYPTKPYPWFSRLQQRNPNASESTGTEEGPDRGAKGIRATSPAGTGQGWECSWRLWCCVDFSLWVYGATKMLLSS